MWRLARWTRSLRRLLVLNAALTGVALCLGGLTRGDADPGWRPATSTVVASCRAPVHAARILTGNLALLGTLAAGAATLGGTTLAVLLVNAFMLGAGSRTLLQARPGAAPLLLSYAPLELAAFVLAAAVTQHVAAGVLRGLATGELPRLRADAAAVALAFLLLLAGAVIEAAVTCRVARLSGA